MNTSSRSTAITLAIGLLVGVGLGYWLGSAESVNSQINDQLVTTMQASTPTSAELQGSRLHQTSATLPPANLLLVGTLLEVDSTRSKAWLLDTRSELTQIYRTNDVLPEGFKVEVIEADALIAIKDGQRYVFRRASRTSDVAATAPPALTEPHVESGNVRNQRRAGRSDQRATFQPSQSMTAEGLTAAWGADSVKDLPEEPEAETDAKDDSPQGSP
ncbi:hypothetical protein [Stenotrophobium rhamnosiphilum]|uniref:Type II secretion system protein GspC N-terminal domain-containing protein n=1 Tax=Stenotrophobium rhamnosiphilum TaxID=2029166 RepID=A0A2T5MEB7_9GAMM|nr:hypothetical protein [Stenotrophobium rhamnosiphilum]PTU30913.1 hypothetical protein CJD38_11415 [Stenotrophobium rhamnosiphilum]